MINIFNFNIDLYKINLFNMTLSKALHETECLKDELYLPQKLNNDNEILLSKEMNPPTLFISLTLYCIRGWGRVPWYPTFRNCLKSIALIFVKKK